MKIYEKYAEALKTFNDFITVSEWAQKVSEMYPDLYKKAEKEAKEQKNDTTGLREIAARISSRLSAGGFKNVFIDESERPRKVKYLTDQEQQINLERDVNDDIEPIKRSEIISQAKDNLKIFELYRLDEFRNIQKAFKDFFSLDFELDHAQALLNKKEQGNHHPDNIQLLLKFHNSKKNNKSWKRFNYERQEKYIKDAIRFHSNVADNFDLELDDKVLSELLKRLKSVFR